MLPVFGPIDWTYAARSANAGRLLDAHAPKATLGAGCVALATPTILLSAGAAAILATVGGAPQPLPRTVEIARGFGRLRARFRDQVDDETLWIARPHQ